jgi:hypothetical protein
MADPAPMSVNAKKNERVINCTNKKNPGKVVTLRVSANANTSAAAPLVVAPNAASAQAVQKAKVNDIVTRIVDSAKTATTENIEAFNILLTEYNTERAKIDPKAEKDIPPIDKSLTGEAIKPAMDAAVTAVQASAPKAGGGRRKTHRKKHGMRSKRHCKTHKKHGGKRSTKHHKKHGKTRGKRSKTHKKRHHKKH